MAVLMLSMFACDSIHAQVDSTEQQEPPAERTKAWTIGGYVKDMVQTGFDKQFGNRQFTNLVHARLNLRYEPGQHWQLRLELRKRIFTGDMVKVPGFSKMLDEDPGAADLALVSQRGDWCWSGLIDRASVRYTAGRWEITAGRQRINWGINTVWNPNDVFNTYNFFDFDYEERPGCDALRVCYAGGKRGSAEGAMRFERDGSVGLAGALYKRTIGKYDVQATGGYAFGDWYAGGGFAGNILKAGFKGEMTLFAPQAGQTGPHAVASGSVDYTFGKGWYVMGSFLYNRHQGNGLFSLQNTMLQRPDVRNMMPVRFSWAGQLSKEINPVLRLSMALIHSPDHNLSIAVPSLGWWLAQNWELSAIGQCVFASSAGTFQNMGNNVFLRIRWSF